MRASHPLFGAAAGTKQKDENTVTPTTPPVTVQPSINDNSSKCPVPEDMRATHLLFGGSTPPTESSETTTTTTTTIASSSVPLTPETSDNMMPAPNQRPAPGQQIELPTSRVQSSIPRGDFTPQHQENVDGAAATSARDDAPYQKEGSSTEDGAAASKWVYPSEQMFFNAMNRKGWGPKEEEMPVVVSIHNAVNERAWGEVMKWEIMHKGECDCPKLFKFMGRPKDLSPRARVNELMGYKKPFDRHDWIVDRCGTKVRYIIDFYEGQTTAQTRGRQGFFLDTRPALDSFGAAFDRAKVWFNRNF